MNKLTRQDKKEIFSTFNLDEINITKDKAFQFCHENGGVWPKEKQFTHTIEETGELIEEVLNNNIKNQHEELGDLCFTYLTYLEEGDIVVNEEEKGSIMRYILQRLKGIDYNKKDLLLLFLNELSKENKVQRKLDGRKDNYKYSELDVKKSRLLSLFTLHLLGRLYGQKVNELTQNSLDKWTKRDVK